MLCDRHFPPDEESGMMPNRNGYPTDDFNTWTGGWNYENYRRVLFVNGEFDPWRSASVSSQFRPGGPLESTKEIPVSIVPGGIHCSDLRYLNGLADPHVGEVINKNIQQIVDWVDEWPGESGNARSSSQSI